jgi:hypothetical protein
MSAATPGTYDILAQLVRSGTPVGSSKTVAGQQNDPLGPFVAVDLGGVDDLWGTTWTVSQINTELAVDCWFDLGTGTAASPFEFDAVGVTVYYTLGGRTYSQTCIAIGISPVFRT